MFGGNLQSSAVVAVQQCDLLLTAFSHQIYLFSLAEASLKDKVAAHRHPILHLHFDTKSSTLHSLDAHGIVYSFRVGKHSVLQQLQRRRAGKVLLREGRIRGSRQAEVEVLGLSEDGTLSRHVGQCDYLVAKQVNRILLLNDDYLVLAKNNSHNLQIYSAVNLQKLYEYDSSIPVTSAEQYQKNLIVGNEQGKIIVLVGFLVGGVVQLTQKLQWHVHAVSSLKVDGAYLYSAGEEGVVVVWHLRQNKKDFLPRIGNAIDNLQFIDSIVYCFLADNSLKAIDLSNDKTILHYKLILNPKTDLIAQSSKKLGKSLLIRASHRADRLFLRGGPGRIQELDLHSGINNEHAIISRNYVSRLDDHLPAPHQLTDICLSKDGTILAVVVEGIGCRSLRFYALEGGLRLVSKVENSHSGQSQITLLALNDNRFLSYTHDDSNVKVWQLTNRKKQSLLEIDEQFWTCDYEISFRKQLPLFVSVNVNRIIITFEQQFIAFNATSKSIDGVYRIEEQERQLVAVVPQNNKFLVFFNNSVELASTFNNAVGKCQLLLSLAHPAITKNSIILTQDNQNFSIFFQQQNSSVVYYSSGTNVYNFQAPVAAQLRLEQLFWLKDRLIGVDSSLFFYDLTHEKQLVQLKKERKEQLSATEQEMDIEQSQTVNYSQLYRKYLERQFKKDRNAVQQSNQILGVSPSISSAFQMLTPQLFL